MVRNEALGQRPLQRPVVHPSMFLITYDVTHTSLNVSFLKSVQLCGIKSIHSVMEPSPLFSKLFHQLKQKLCALKL